jgi:hypothetical protein
MLYLCAITESDWKRTLSTPSRPKNDLIASYEWISHASGTSEEIIGHGLKRLCESITQDALSFGQQCNPLDESQARQLSGLDFPPCWL